MKVKLDNLTSITKVTMNHSYNEYKGPGMLNELGSGLPSNSYKPITYTAWVRARLCRLQKGVHSTLNRKC